MWRANAISAGRVAADAARPAANNAAKPAASLSLVITAIRAVEPKDNLKKQAVCAVCSREFISICYRPARRKMKNQTLISGLFCIAVADCPPAPTPAPKGQET